MQGAKWLFQKSIIKVKIFEEDTNNQGFILWHESDGKTTQREGETIQDRDWPTGIKEISNWWTITAWYGSMCIFRNLNKM